MLLSHGATAVRARAGGERQGAVKQQQRAAPSGAAEQPQNRRMLLAGAGAWASIASRAALLLTRSAPPALAAAAAPAQQRAAAAPTAAPAPQRVAAAPAAPAKRAGPPMNGPPQSVLALSYAAIAGLGLLFVSTQGKEAQDDDFTTAFPGTPSPLAAMLSPPTSETMAAGKAATEKWRADAAKEYERRALVVQKRKLEADWFAAYNEKLRNDVALRSQVSRSASNQVQRNKAVREKASSEAVDQDVAPKKRGILSAIASLLPFRKKK